MLFLLYVKSSFSNLFQSNQQRTCNFDLVSSEIDSTVYDWNEIRRLLKYHMPQSPVSIFPFFPKDSTYIDISDEEQEKEIDECKQF